MLEFLLVELVLFWEKVSMKKLLVKNMIAHRQRNVYTSLIYSLTIGTLIFMLVTLSIETQQIFYTANTYGNINVAYRQKGVSGYLASECDPILLKY